MKHHTRHRYVRRIDRVQDHAGFYRERLSKPLVMFQVPLFDGGECEEKWMRYGMPKGHVPDQYVKKCKAGAVNVHILKLGSYELCEFCEHAKKCRDYAGCCGEQMDP